jgi:hypothetical protein
MQPFCQRLLIIGKWLPCMGNNPVAGAAVLSLPWGRAAAAAAAEKWL